MMAYTAMVSIIMAVLSFSILPLLVRMLLKTTSGKQTRARPFDRIKRST